VRDTNGPRACQFDHCQTRGKMSSMRDVFPLESGLIFAEPREPFAFRECAKVGGGARNLLKYGDAAV
jgi:hypothetical protein